MIEKIVYVLISISFIFCFFYMVVFLLNHLFFKKAAFTLKFCLLKLVPVLTLSCLVLQSITDDVWNFLRNRHMAPGLIKIPPSVDIVLISQHSTFLEKLISFFFVFWFLILLALLIKYIFEYIHFQKRYLNNEQLLSSLSLTETLNEWKHAWNIQDSVNIYYSPLTHMPFTCGILHPKILIPVGTHDHLDLIIRHELMHCIHKDVQIKFFVKMFGLIQWYNPMFYLYNAELEKYCEYACDEKIVNTISFEDRKRYAATILHFAKNSTKNPVLSSGFSADKDLSQRLKCLLYPRDIRKNYRRFWIFTGIGSAIIIASYMLFQIGTLPTVPSDVSQNKLIKVNFHPEKTPDEYWYEEYQDGFWWRGTLSATETRRISSKLVEVTFEGSINKYID